ncbi:MAG: polysaccharide deacetylase family protein [Clostridia bacterium]|nr:polysaccharide deacetylase family protein [Clostridia bacterium]
MFVVVKKRQVVLAAVLCLLLAAGTIAGVLLRQKAENAAAKANKLLPVYSVRTEENKVALTFDAAWGSDKTEKILDLLDTYGVKATFFLVGFWIEENPELTQEIASRGHCIGNHSQDHPHMPTLGPEKMDEQIESVNASLEKSIGARPVFFRPPFGDYDNALISLLEKKGMIGIQWSVDSLDWKGISGKEIAERVLSRVQKGSIILCHNNSDHILEALPLILLGLKNKGLISVPMDKLVMTENYFIDNNGTQTKLT